MSAALRLLPLPGSPDPRSIGRSWAQLLAAPVAVVEPVGAIGDREVRGQGAATAIADRVETTSEPPLVLFGRGRDVPLATELERELERRERPAPLAFLRCGAAAAPAAAEGAAAVVELGPREGMTELAEPLSRELSHLVDLGREVRSFVGSELLDGVADEVTDTTPLLELGIVDSISIVSVVAFIEEELDVRVPDEEIHPRHLTDPLAIQRLIVSLSRRSSRGSTI